MASGENSWSLLLVFEIIAAISFIYVSKNPISVQRTGGPSCGIVVTRVLLVLFFLLCPLVHQFLLPVHSIVPTVEKLLDNAAADADATKSQVFLLASTMYNAIGSCVVAACVFAAYIVLLGRYNLCAQAMGQAHIQLEKDRERSVSFAEETVRPIRSSGTSCKIKRGVVIYGATLMGCIAVLPRSMECTFAYTFVEHRGLRLTSDHVWLSATVLFAAIMTRRVWLSFNNFPAGYCKGLYAAAQFTIGYGSVLCVSAAAFLALAADVMVTYTYKVMQLHQMRALQPLAQAENVMLHFHVNAWTGGFADYLVDCTFAAVAPCWGDEAVLLMLRNLAVFYRGILIDCLDILLFGCLVFAPMTIFMLVSIRWK